MEMVSGKVVKSLEFSCLQSYDMCFISNFFRFGQILFNLALTFAAHLEKDFVPSFPKVCIDHLFDNLESGKRKYCFGKKSAKSLEFWIQKSVCTLY